MVVKSNKRIKKVKAWAIGQPEAFKHKKFFYLNDIYFDYQQAKKVYKGQIFPAIIVPVEITYKV